MMARKSAGTVQGVSLEAVRKFALAARATEDTRPLLTCGYAQGESLATADGFRLHVAVFADESARKRCEAGENAWGLIGLGENSRAIADKGGRFPDFAAIIPKWRGDSSAHVRLSVRREELLALVKTAEVFARDNNDSVRFGWDSESRILTVTGRSVERGDVSSAMPAFADSAIVARRELVWAANAHFMIDALRLMQSEFITLAVESGSKPILLDDTVQTEAGAVELFTLIMPMSVDKRVPYNGPVTDTSRDLADGARALCDVDNHTFEARGKSKVKPLPSTTPLIAMLNKSAKFYDDGAKTLRLVVRVETAASAAQGEQSSITADPAPILVSRKAMEARAFARGMARARAADRAYKFAHRADLLLVSDPAENRRLLRAAQAQYKRANRLDSWRGKLLAFLRDQDEQTAWQAVVMAWDEGSGKYTAAEQHAPIVALDDKPADVCEAQETIKADTFAVSPDADKPVYVRPGRQYARKLHGMRKSARAFWRSAPSVPSIEAPTIPAADPEPVPSEVIKADTFTESINALTFDDLCALLADRLASAAIGRVNARLVEVGREMRTAQAHIIRSIEAAHPAAAQAPIMPTVEDMPLVCEWDKPADVSSEPINPKPFGPDWSEWGEFWENPPSPDLDDTQPMPVIDPDDDPDPDPAPGGGGHALRTFTHIRGGFDGTYEIMDSTGAVYTFTREAFNQLYCGVILPNDRFSAFCEFLPPLAIEDDAQTENALQNADHSDGVGGPADDKGGDVCEAQETIKADTFDAAWRGRAWVRLYWRLGRRAMDAYAAGDVGLFERLMTRRERLEHEPLRKRWNGGDIDRAANLAAIREFFPGVESDGDNYSDDAIRDFDWRAMKHGVKVGILEIDRAYLRFSKLEHELGIARRSNASAEAIARIEHDIYAARRWAGFWMVWRSNEWRAVMEYYQLLGIADDLMDRVLAWDSAIKHANSKDEARTAYTELVMAVRNGLRWDEQIQAYRKHLEGVYRLWGSIPVWSTFYTTFGSRISAFAQRSLGTTRKEAAAQWHIRLAKNEVEGMNKTSHRRREAILRSLG